MATTHHLVLARKWRPDRFAELVGQEHVTKTLSQALTSGRVAHAFLFTGIRGVGKTTAARILARCLNCDKGPTPDPCGECAACIEIRQGRALDVVEIDGATYRKIDDARVIIENLSYRPARDRFKIYIIDEAHQLTDQAFNALLKTLEEPPPHIKFILATTEPQKMPETILSRLQRYDFRRIPFATIRSRLEELARRETVEVEPAALTLLAREAGGSMRDGERMLETAIALSAGAVVESEVAQILGVASRSRLYRLTEAILKKDAGSALNAVRELHQRGANLESLGRDLLETLRNLVVAKLPNSGVESPLSELPDQESAEIRRLAALGSQRDLMRLFRLMAQTQEEILRSPYTDLLLEMAVVRMATIAAVLDADELMRAIGRAEKAEPGPSSGGSGAGDASTTQAPAPARRMKVAGEVKADAPRKDPVEPEPAVSTPDLPNDLPKLRDFIRARKAPLAGFMEQGASLSLEADVLTVIPRKDIYVRYLNDNKSTIAALASELYDRKISVNFKSQQQGVTNSGPSFPERRDRSEAFSASDLPNNSRVVSAAGGSSATFDGGSKSGLEQLVDSARTAQENSQASSAAEREQTRKALYTDPVVRLIFDELQGRLVEVREKSSSANNEKVDPKATDRS